MKAEVQSIVGEARRFHKRIGDLVKSYGYSSDNKSQLVLAYLSIIEEHHQAMLLLIENDLIGSAFALVRCPYDAFCRAHWVIGVASESEIDRICKGEKVFPRMPDMVSKIDDAFKTGDFFQRVEEDSWGAMSDYIHSGILQISRRFEGNEIWPNYEADEIVEVLDGLNIQLILMARLFFKYFGKEEAAREVEKILAEYTEAHKKWGISVAKKETA